MSKPTTDAPVKLLGLRVRDFNRIEVAEMEFAGDGLVPVAGKNGQGKSSALNALAWGFGGPRVLEQSESPIRKGARAADVFIRTSGFTLERRQTASGQKFVVRGTDGRELKTAQAALDAMYSALTFDPLAFARMKPAEQRAAIISALGLEEPLARIDADRKAAFDERTAAGRQLKALRAQLEGMPQPDEFAPAEEESAAAIVAEMSSAREALDYRRHVSRGIDSDRQALQQSRGRIASLEAELVAERAKASEIGERVELATATLETLPPLPDLAALEAKLAGVETTNRMVRDAKAWREKEAEVTAAQFECDQLSDAIEDCDGAKDSLLFAAKLPVEGLRIEDDGLTLDGVALSQASTAQLVELGTHVAIAQEPVLRVLRIAEGTLLDRDTRARVDRLAREHGLLVLAEMVADYRTDDPTEIWIEDGHTVPA